MKTTKAGSRMQGLRSPTRLSMTASALAALGLACGGAYAEPAATVMFASGEVHVLSAKGESKDAKAGLLVDSGETIQTVKGRVQLRMVDGAMMSLNERTVLRLDDYHLAGPAGDDERGYMSLLSGALRTISGSIGKPRVDHYRLDTPAGTIGIRGTEYTAAVDGGLRVGVMYGRVAVCNDGGCVDVPKGSSASTANRSVRPTVSPRLSLLVPPVGSTVAPHVASSATDAGSRSDLLADMDSTTLASALAPTAGVRVAQALDKVLTTPTATGSSMGTGGDAGTSSSPSTGTAASAGTSLDTGLLPTLAPATDTSSAGASVSSSLITIVPAPAPGGAVTVAPAPTPTAAPAPTGTPAPLSPPAATPSPAASPAPGPAASPAPVSSPTPSPAPMPTATPLANGNGTLGLVWSTDKGDQGSGLTQGTVTFDSHGGLQELDVTGKGQPILHNGTAVDPGSDGIVAWGRWVDGQSKVNGATGVGKGNIASLHYVAFLDTPTLPVLGAFNSFASTAPTVTSAGTLVATGVANSAGGSMNIAFLTVVGGTALYNLHVPVAGQTFNLSGVATQTSAYGFSGVSAIASSGQGCTGGCTGSLGNNVSVIGLIGGSLGNRAGITYGFNSQLGNVAGVIVFKH